MESKNILGAVSKIASHDGDRYGIQVLEDERWFNGFHLPRWVREGSIVSIEYIEKEHLDQIYYNVLKINAEEGPAGSKVHTMNCPECGHNFGFKIMVE